MSNYSDLKLMAQHATGFTDMSLAPDVVLELIAAHDELVDLRARLAERDALLREAGLSLWEGLEAPGPLEHEFSVSDRKLVNRIGAALSASAEPSAPVDVPTEHADSCSWANGESEVCDCGYQSARVERKRHIARTDAVYDASWVSERLTVPKCMDAIRPIPLRDIVRDLVAEVIGGDAYDCTRVWSAWGVGTMSEDDFIPLTDQDERLYEIADAILEKFKELSQ